MLYIFLSSEPGVKFALLVVTVMQRELEVTACVSRTAGQLILIVWLVLLTAPNRTPFHGFK